MKGTAHSQHELSTYLFGEGTSFMANVTIDNKKKISLCLLDLLVHVDHLLVLDLVGSDGLPEEAVVQLPPYIREPDVVQGSDANFSEQHAQ